ncbi:hypothetical protein [[Ruminococcus] lactaris]|uniref:hypothetical protein n=1 Tax=[Ruminococcus] lactaris TaxID=46228 RepID=UPI00351FA400
MEKAVAKVAEVLPDSITADKKRWYAVKFLENDSKVVESMDTSSFRCKQLLRQPEKKSKKSMMMIWRVL